MRTLVHDTDAGTGSDRLVNLGLSPADFEFVLGGADAFTEVEKRRLLSPRLCVKIPPTPRSPAGRGTAQALR